MMTQHTKFSTKERNQRITVKVQIEYKLNNWLRKDIIDLGLIFDLSVRTINVLKSKDIFKLRDLLLFSRKELTEKLREENPRFKLGPVSEKEIDIMLNKLGLKLRGE